MKAVARQNMAVKMPSFVCALTSQWERSWLKALAPQRKWLKFEHLRTSHMLMSSLNVERPLKTLCMLVTSLTSHRERSQEVPLVKPDLVHRLMKSRIEPRRPLP